MNVGVLRLGFAAFWLTVAGLLVCRGHVAPDDRSDPQSLDLWAALAVAFAGWNVFRWYGARRPRPAGPENPLLRHRRRPLEPRREERPPEYHPEFDFGRSDLPQKPRGATGESD